MAGFLSLLPPQPPVPLASSSAPPALNVGRSRPKRDGEKVPRPVNSWIIFRSETMRELRKLEEYRKMPQAQISKIISQRWKDATPDVKAHYEFLADIKKFEHKQEHPDYVYKPQKKEERERQRQEEKEAKQRARLDKQRRAKAQDASSLSSHFVSSNHMPYYNPHQHVRSLDTSYPSPPLSDESTPPPCSPTPPGHVVALPDASTSTHPPTPPASTSAETPAVAPAALDPPAVPLATYPAAAPVPDVLSLITPDMQLTAVLASSETQWNYGYTPEQEAGPSAVDMDALLPPIHIPWLDEPDVDLVDDMGPIPDAAPVYHLGPEASDDAPDTISLSQQETFTMAENECMAAFEKFIESLGLPPLQEEDGSGSGSAVEPSVDEDPFAFINFDVDPFFQNAAVPAPSMPPAPTTPYVPPAGAMNSGMRRVAGSWHPAQEYMDSPMIDAWDGQTF